MSDPIIIGTAGETPLDLDLKRLIGSHGCIIANSGGGKSGLLRKLLEQTHGHVQHIVLDVEDEFYSLRERFEYVIAGGDDGDVPIALDTAASLAINALEHGFSLVVQLNDLGADAPEYVSRFLGGLMSAPKHLWHPVLVTIDELQRFASKDSGEATPAIKDLMFRGRKRGFTGLFASLRMAEIDPGIRGMVNNWMLGRVGQALDRKTMAEQLGFSAAESRGKLAHMVERHFWAMGPALTVEPTLFRVAEVETTPVHAGQAKVPTPPAPEALRAILAGLAAVPQAPQSDAKAPSEGPNATSNGPNATSSAQLADAERMELVALRTERDEWTVERSVGQQQLDALVAENKALRDIIGSAWADICRIKPALEVLEAVGSEVEDSPSPHLRSKGSLRPESSQERPPATLQSDSIARPGPTRDAPTASHPPRWQRILDALAWASSMLKKDAVERNIVAWFADTSPKSSGFQNDLGAMRAAGLIDYPGSGLLKLTEAGGAKAVWPKSAPTRDDLLDAIKRRLEPRFHRILDAVCAAHSPLNRAELAEEIGISANSSGFQNDLGKLRTLGLIDYPAPGLVWTGDVLR